MTAQQQHVHSAVSMSDLKTHKKKQMELINAVMHSFYAIMTHGAVVLYCKLIIMTSGVISDIVSWDSNFCPAVNSKTKVMIKPAHF